MGYRIKRARYKDGTKSPWYKIVMYKRGRPVGECETQFSSFWDAVKIVLLNLL